MTKQYKEVDSGVEVDDRLNTVCATNDEGFARIVKLYARPGDEIAELENGRLKKQIEDMEKAK